MTDGGSHRDNEVMDESVRNFLWRLRARLLSPGNADRAERDLDEILVAAVKHAHVPRDQRVVVLRRSPLEGLGRIAAAIVILAGASGGAVQLVQITRAPAAPTTADVQALDVVEVPPTQAGGAADGGAGPAGTSSGASPSASDAPTAEPEAEVTPSPKATPTTSPSPAGSPEPQATRHSRPANDESGSPGSAGDPRAPAADEGEACPEPDQRPWRTRSADQRDCPSEGASPSPQPSPSPSPDPRAPPEDEEEARHDYEDRSRLDP